MRTLYYFMAPDEPGSGGDPEADPDPDDPELPFEPLHRTPQGKYVISPTLAAALDKLAAPVDDGQPANHPDPNKPPPPTPTPAQILAEVEPPVNTTGLTRDQIKQAESDRSARMLLRYDGTQLLAVGTGTPNLKSATMDRVASVFRADLREYWNYCKSSMDSYLQTDEDGNAKRKAFANALIGDGKLMDALKAWADGWSANTTDWTSLETNSNDILSELTTFRQVISEAYPDVRDTEAFMLNVLDAIAHEVARQAAVHLPGGPVDTGGRYTGVAYATRQAAPTQAAVDDMKLSLTKEGQASAINPSKYLKLAFTQARDATRAANSKPWLGVSADKAPQWATDLMNSADAWAKTSAIWNSGLDPGQFKALTNDFVTKLNAARNAVNSAAPPPAARRAAERALDELATAVAERIEELGKNSIPIKATLELFAKQLRQAVTISVATDPLSAYWSNAKKSALSLLPSSEANALSKNWFTSALSDALDDWSKQMMSVPNHDRDKLLSDTWTIANALTRYKIAANTMSNEGAHAQLFDAIDALSGSIATRLELAEAMGRNL